MPGETSWWGYALNGIIVFANGRYIVEIWQGRKGIVTTPRWRKPRVFGTRREYSVYVRNIMTKKESFLDGKVAQVALAILRRPIELARLADGEALEFDSELFTEFKSLEEFITKQLRFE